MSFAVEIRRCCKLLGTAKAASLCGVTPRTLQLWARNAGNPKVATRVGALAILRSANGKGKEL